MRHRAHKTRPRTHMGLAVTAAISVGAAAGMVGRLILHDGRVAPWTVTVTVPVGGSMYLHAVDVAATVIAAALAVTVLLAWLAAHTAVQQRHWRKDGGTIIRGDTASRFVLTPETVAANRERLAEVERNCATLKAEVGTLRTGIQVIGEGLITACVGAGQEPPELPDMEEPPTAPVLRLIRGEAG